MFYESSLTGEDLGFEKGSPQHALQDFYHAFNHRDLNATSENWLHTDDVSMSNPLGGVKRGWHEIENVYRRVFTGKVNVYVEFYDYSIYETEHFFCAVGRERGWFEFEKTKTSLAIRTSRHYLKVGDNWLQLHHHGSIEQPLLLQSYQDTINGTNHKMGGNQ